MHESSEKPRSRSFSELTTPVYLALVAAIGMVGLVIRVVDLGTIPPGLHFDQAANGLLSLEILTGRHPIFFQATLAARRSSCT
jgi:hypothetical protein